MMLYFFLRVFIIINPRFSFFLNLLDFTIISLLVMHIGEIESSKTLFVRNHFEVFLYFPSLNKWLDKSCYL